uniref:LITAF domain-containing protein n=1 Tax=Eucampia antarctica TaxID=49252 RepID=A0A7S2SEF7_9STRA|mmetsp:Transcript_6784/g.6368  ORF Transcript_6784/g.6368 Transcript_6784/m.6368 type:complete len:166 (+) Transcript_6784:83-580(+)
MGFLSGEKKVQNDAAVDIPPGTDYVATLIDGTIQMPPKADVENATVILDAQVVLNQPKLNKVQTITTAAPNNCVPQKLANPVWKRHPVELPQCPKCNLASRTRIVTYSGIITWLLVIALFFLYWPIFWIPLVIGKCKHTDHSCVTCNHKVGTLYPFQDCCSKHRE